MPLSKQTKAKFPRWHLAYIEISNLAEYAKDAAGESPAFTEEQLEQEVVNVTNTIMDLLDPENPRPSWILPTN